MTGIYYLSGVLIAGILVLCLMQAVKGEVSGEGKEVCGGVAAVSCPVKCFRTDPVCGVDGVTYWCGCTEAACAGAQVAKLGFCEVGSGGSVHLCCQALLLVHIVWLIVLGFSIFFGLF